MDRGGMRVVKYICIWLLKAYKATLSRVKGKTCRFTPSCSVYGMEAFEAHGFFKGGWLTAKRVFKCGFTRGGFDPVPFNLKGDILWL